jgi:hypothetical protein
MHLGRVSDPMKKRSLELLPTTSINENENEMRRIFYVPVENLMRNIFQEIL